MPETRLLIEKDISSQEIPTSDLLRVLFKARWKYLILLFIVFASSFYLLRYHILSYESSTAFYISESTVVTSPGLDMRGVESLNPVDNFNRIYQLVNSTPVHMHLIKKFNLLKHYGIDTTKEFYMAKAVDQIRSNIRVSKTPFSSIIVTVNDIHRYLAAEMANEIVYYTDQLHRNIIIDGLDNKIRISNAMITDLRQEYDSKTRSIENLLNVLATHSRSQSGVRDEVSTINREQKLNEMLFILQSSTRELINTKKLYTLAKQTIIEKNRQSLIPIVRAMPMSRSLIYKTSVFSILATVAVGFAIILFQYFRLRYSDHLKILFPGKIFPPQIN